MKAVVHHVYGTPDDLRLEDVEMPAPGADEVLLRVRAVGINWADYSILTGIPYMVRLGFGLRRPRRGIRGTDVAGEVEAVGSKVIELTPGDHVFGWCGGSLAEYACAPEGNLVSKPERLTFEEAAATPMAGLVALQALRDVGDVQPGQEVLVVGASGGIGTFAVQIAKAMGAKVTGVCSTRNMDLVASLGASRVIDYTRQDFTEGEDRYDFILDIADNHSLADRRRVLTPNGTLVPNSGEGGRWVGSLGRIIGARLLSPFVPQRLHPFLSTYKREDLISLRELMDSGDVTPVVGKTYSLTDAAEAMQLVGARHSVGKTVVTV